MKFQFQDASCDVDVFRHEHDLVVRFYDQTKEHSADELCNLVIVDPGYGYISMKYKGTNALLSGFLDAQFFDSDDMMNAAIEFVESLSPLSADAYIPHHVRRFRDVGYIEYNGEF